MLHHVSQCFGFDYEMSHHISLCFGFDYEMFHHFSQCFRFDYEMFHHVSRCFRFDYEGCGESDGDIRHVTLSDWRDDVLTVLDHLTTGPQVRPHQH